MEAALEAQLMALQHRRHENARWWRNLNRFMISLGVVIIVVIVSVSILSADVSGSFIANEALLSLSRLHLLSSGRRMVSNAAAFHLRVSNQLDDR